MNLLNYSIPPLTVAEEERYLNDLSSDSKIDVEKAREKLLLSNLKLIKQWALELHTDDLPLEDLITEGIIGFMHAIEKYKPGMGTRLTSYSRWWVLQKMRIALQKKSRIVRVPTRALGHKARLLKAQREFKKKFHREPTVNELAEYVELPPERVREYLFSLCADIRIAAEEDEELSDVERKLAAVTFAQSNIQDQESAVRVDCLKSAWNKLSDRDKLVLTLRFGLDDKEPCSYMQVAEETGKCAETIRKIEAEALVKLKRNMEL